MRRNPSAVCIARRCRCRFFFVQTFRFFIFVFLSSSFAFLFPFFLKNLRFKNYQMFPDLFFPPFFVFVFSPYFHSHFLRSVFTYFFILQLLSSFSSVSVIYFFLDPFLPPFPSEFAHFSLSSLIIQFFFFICFKD